MNIAICPELAHKSDPFGVANLVSYSSIDLSLVEVTKNTSPGDFLRAACSLGIITEEIKEEKLKNNCRNLATQMDIVWNKLSNWFSIGKIIREEQVSPSYFVQKFDLGKPSCFLEDINSGSKLVTNSDFTNNVSKKLLIKEFRKTTQGIESMTFFDTYISIIETIYRGFIETGFDIFYENESITYIFDIIYPRFGPLILGICKSCKAETHDWMEASLRKVLTNYKIAKKMIFSPFMERPEISKKQNMQMLTNGQKRMIYSFKVITKYPIPIEYPVENVTYISKVVDMFLMKARYMKLPITVPVIQKMNQTTRYVIRSLRAFTEQSIKADQKLANVFVSAASLCVSFINIRSLSLKEGDTFLQKSIGVIDKPLSGPEKIISVITDNIIASEAARVGIAEVINYFNKVDLDQVITIYKSVCLFVNTLIDYSSDAGTDFAPKPFVVIINENTLSISSSTSKDEFEEFDFENEDWQRNVEFAEDGEQ